VRRREGGRREKEGGERERDSLCLLIGCTETSFGLGERERRRDYVSFREQRRRRGREEADHD